MARTECPLTSDELGDVGESEFQKLCARAKLIANHPRRDRGGWDYVVQIAQIPAAVETLDSRPSLVTSHIQVKATMRGPRPRVKLRLSSAEMLAKYVGASFIAALVFDRNDLDQYDIYMIEMIGERLAKVLKALRRQEKANRRAVNETFIAFDLAKAERLSESTGFAIRDRIMAAVAGDEIRYVAQKAEQRRTLGFGTDRLRATLTLHDVKPADTIDLLLGVRGFIGSISDVNETRFGISLPSNALPTGQGLIKLSPEPVSDCRVKVRSQSLRRALSFDGKFYHASVPGPQGIVWKSRLDFGFFEIIRTKNGYRLQSTAPGNDKRHRFPEWIDFYRLAIAVGSKDTAFELTLARDGPVLRWSDQAKRGTDKAKRVTNSDLQQRLELFETAQRVLVELGLGQTLVTATEVFANQKQIYAAAGFSLEHARHVRISFVPSVQPEPQDFPTRRLYVGLLDLGGSRVAYAAKVDLVRQESAEGDEWFTSEHASVALESIAFSAAAFGRFVQAAKQTSGIDEVLLDELDAAFLNEALGEVRLF